MDPEIRDFRREQRQITWMGWLFRIANFGFIGWVVYAIMIDDRRDLFYALPSIFGTVSGISRYLVHRVRVAPKPLLALRSPDAATRERAWEVVSAHREELFRVTILQATTREPPLAELDREALTERVARAGDTDWRRLLRIWFWIWLPLAFAVFFATLFYTYNPIEVRY